MTSLMSAIGLRDQHARRVRLVRWCADAEMETLDLFWLERTMHEFCWRPRAAASSGAARNGTGLLLCARSLLRRTKRRLEEQKASGFSQKAEDGPRRPLGPFGAQHYILFCGGLAEVSHFVCHLHFPVCAHTLDARVVPPFVGPGNRWSAGNCSDLSDEPPALKRLRISAEYSSETNRKSTNIKKASVCLSTVCLALPEETLVPSTTLLAMFLSQCTEKDVLLILHQKMKHIVTSRALLEIQGFRDF